MSYVPNPDHVRKEMLAYLGISSASELFNDIPDKLKLKKPTGLGRGLTEMELRRELARMAAANMNTDTYPCFLGAGAYDHYIPAAVEQLVSRSEFYTAYTPYQPEISQGILQGIFEYQTMMSMLTGMDLANASMYDGGSALAEACALACDNTRRRSVLVPDTVNPAYIKVLKTYAMSGRMDIEVVPGQGGVADAEAMLARIDKNTACVVLQNPNFFGNLEPAISDLEKAVHNNKGLLIMCVDPISLGLIKPPGEWGADVAVGEGQALGNPMSFGGPFLGFMAASSKLMRRIPGRLVGETVDQDGIRSYVLTLQAREQHIRREKAGSNICSNEALCALAATIYLAMIGRQGLKEIALRCHQAALYARNELEKAGVKPLHRQPFFKEFAVSLSDPRNVNKALLEQGIIGGYELDGGMLLAFTEKRTGDEIDRLVAVIGGMARG